MTPGDSISEDRWIDFDDGPIGRFGAHRYFDVIFWAVIIIGVWLTVYNAHLFWSAPLSLFDMTLEAEGTAVLAIIAVIAGIAAIWRIMRRTPKQPPETGPKVQIG